MLLELRGLSVPAAEPGGRALLPGPVDLPVAPGAAISVEGPSGAGKSTLLRAIALLEPRALGEVRFEGQPIATRDVPAYRRRVQLVAQAPVRLPGSLRDNLAVPFALASAGGSAFDESRAVALCERLGLCRDQLSLEAERLSGGEAQRLALVRALLLDPLVLLLDEPTASLDPDTQTAAEAALGAWRAADPRRALLLVSHDPAQRQRLARDHRVLRPDGSLREAARGP